MHTCNCFSFGANVQRSCKILVGNLIWMQRLKVDSPALAYMNGVLNKTTDTSKLILKLNQNIASYVIAIPWLVHI